MDGIPVDADSGPVDDRPISQARLPDFNGSEGDCDPLDMELDIAPHVWMQTADDVVVGEVLQLTVVTELVEGGVGPQSPDECSYIKPALDITLGDVTTLSGSTPSTLTVRLGANTWGHWGTALSGSGNNPSWEGDAPIEPGMRIVAAVYDHVYYDGWIAMGGFLEPMATVIDGTAWFQDRSAVECDYLPKVNTSTIDGLLVVDLFAALRTNGNDGLDADVVADYRAWLDLDGQRNLPWDLASYGPLCALPIEPAGRMTDQQGVCESSADCEDRLTCDEGRCVLHNDAALQPRREGGPGADRSAVE